MASVVLPGFPGFFAVFRFNDSMLGAYLDTSQSDTFGSGRFAMNDTLRSEHFLLDTFRSGHFPVATLPGRDISFSPSGHFPVERRAWNIWGRAMFFARDAFRYQYFSLAVFCAEIVSTKVRVLLIPTIGTTYVARSSIARHCCISYHLRKQNQDFSSILHLLSPA